MTDRCQNFLSADQKTGLDNWRRRIESLLVATVGRASYAELMFWLKPMGFQFLNNQLSLPSSIFATADNLWSYIELYWLDWNWYYAGLRNPEQEPTRGNIPVVLRLTPAPDQAGLRSLLARYPASTTVPQVMEHLYVDLSAKLVADETFIKAHVSGYNIDYILAGLLVLFEFFLAFSEARSYSDPIYTGHSGWGYIHLYATGSGNFSWTNSTVGPYTVSICACENGVIRGITSNITLPKLTIVHQSVEASMGIQTRTDSTVDADIALSKASSHSLDADVAIRDVVRNPVEASMPLRGKVSKSLIAYEGLRDLVDFPLEASELLADKTSLSLMAYERLLFTHRVGLDADMCIHAPVQHALICHMLLLPDSKSMIKVDLMKYYIQKFRLWTDPIPYQLFNSLKDKKIIR